MNVKPVQVTEAEPEVTERTAEDFGDRFEARAEEFGESIDEKLKKLPAWLNALGDSACITIALVAVYYILRLFDIVVFGGIAWFVWLIVFAVIFVVSFAIRSAIRRAHTTDVTSGAASA